MTIDSWCTIQFTSMRLITIHAQQSHFRLHASVKFSSAAVKWKDWLDFCGPCQTVTSWGATRAWSRPNPSWHFRLVTLKNSTRTLRAGISPPTTTPASRFVRPIRTMAVLNYSDIKINSRIFNEYGIWNKPDLVMMVIATVKQNK